MTITRGVAVKWRFHKPPSPAPFAPQLRLDRKGK
jgi:hypothetical protein